MNFFCIASWFKLLFPYCLWHVMKWAIPFSIEKVLVGVKKAEDDISPN